jgi:mono/diheme cytochrome c family protein
MRYRILIFVMNATFLLAFPFVSSSATAAKKTVAMSAAQRGKYLTIIGGCNDCHTPKNFSEKGMEPDMTRELSGHPADSKLPDLPAGLLGPGKWGTMTTDLTAWYGPWGVSFTKNLTPDLETGLGSWTEEMFIKALRTGKHMGAPEGREILPPMPWQMYAQMTDEDLKAVWAYLRTLKPIKNAVPEPIPPQMPASK